MAIKAINNIVGPNSIIPTLLVFGAYPHITKDSPTLLSITIRAKTIRKATREI